MNREEMRRLAEEIDRLEDSGHELDGFQRIDATIAADLKAVVVLEMGHEVLAQISVAAREAGEDVNDFMRTAAMERIARLKSKRAPAAKKASA